MVSEEMSFANADRQTDTYLNSSQCARGKSSIAQKWKTIPKYFSGNKIFKNVTLQILNFITVS